MHKIFGIIILIVAIVLSPSVLYPQVKADTTYISIAPKSVQNLLAPGKAPVFTLQISGFYDIGLTDLAANDNTNFSKEDFINGKDYGTRYGYGIGLLGKISLHKRGNVRLLVSADFNRFESHFIIPGSPEGKVGYNVFSGGLGVENCFTPNRKFKYSLGFEVVASLINGEAVLSTDSTNFKLTIKNAFRIGASANFGFEYAFSDIFGINLGIKLTHANLLLKESKASANPNESYLNDKKPSTPIPFAGWKQFFYTSFYSGINFYFGMKNKK